MAMTFPDNTVIEEALYDLLNGNIGTGVSFFNSVSPQTKGKYAWVLGISNLEDSAKDTYVWRSIMTIEIVIPFRNAGSKKTANDVMNSIVGIMRASFSGQRTLTGFNIIDLTVGDTRDTTDSVDEFKILRKEIDFEYIIVQT